MNLAIKNALTIIAVIALIALNIFVFILQAKQQEVEQANLNAMYAANNESIQYDEQQQQRNNDYYAAITASAATSRSYK